MPGEDGGGFAHWMACSGGGLYTARKATNGTLRTGGVVLEGLCALPAATSVQTPAKTRFAVYKVGPVEKPVYKPPSEQGPQCTKSLPVRFATQRRRPLFCHVIEKRPRGVGARH